MEWNVGCFYSTYIGGYSGSCRPDSPVSEANRFFPSPGNHDWDTGTLDPYIDYFELPGNERYYNFRRGPVEFFALDSDPLEPDGVTATSVQAFWLQQAMEASTAPFKLVYMHHPPYSSGSHGDTTYMQWPFEEWGASLVSAGHDHTYERLRVGALTHVINGSGGIDLRDFDTWSAGSQVQDEVNHGAQRVVADNRQLTIEFISVAGGVVDQYTHRPGAVWALQSREGEAVIDRDAVWSYADQGLAPPEDWTLPSFDDSAWASGPGPLGYGEGDEGTAVGWGEFNDFRHVTTWFRHEFELETVCDLRNLRLELVRDDAAMVYLNGHEVLRSNLPAGPVEPTTIALDNLGGSADNAFVETWLDPYLLHEGPNVLAVEVHQSTPWSSDLRMELELTAFR